MTGGELDDDDRYDVWYDAMDLLTKKRDPSKKREEKAIARRSPSRKARWRIRRPQPAAQSTTAYVSAPSLSIRVPSRSKRSRDAADPSPQTATPPLRRSSAAAHG
jgi:hypothetical protein